MLVSRPSYKTKLFAGGLIDAINKLIVSVNTLNNKVAEQANTINGLVRLLEECDLCNKKRKTCATDPPGCFPGVQCHETADGPRCGSCPRGYIGNGYECRPGQTCADRPCYPGVQCRDTEYGAQCGPCPSGYEGDGMNCERRTGCEFHPCHPGE